MSVADELEKIARLACLSIDAEGASQLKSDVGDILDFVKTLQQVDTKDIHPSSHPLKLEQRFAEDEPNMNSNLEALAAIAPLFEDGLYLVPKVIEGKK